MAALENPFTVYEDEGTDDDTVRGVLHFLERQYFSREVLFNRFMMLNAAQLTAEVCDVVLADLRLRYELILENRAMLLVAEERATRRRVAVGLTVLEKRHQCDQTPPWEQVGIRSRMFGHWHAFVQQPAERCVDFFKRFKDVNTIMRVVLICVEEQHERKRIGTNMLSEIMERARIRDIDLVYGVFTSHWLQVAAKKLGFQNYHDIHVTEFRDSLGSAIYPESFHPYVVSVMAVKFT